MRKCRLKTFLCCAVVGQVYVASACFAQEAVPDLVERGKYLAIAADCTACHRNPVSGNAFSGGYRVKTPLGEVVASNITPSKISGIGNWRLSRFADAVRKGRVGLHFFYPVMPYPEYSGISDEDIKALYSYFQLGVRPDENMPPTTRLGFPFNIRFLMIGWNVFFGGGSPTPDAQTSGVNRGRYLTTVLGHCSSCHSPRNVFMGTDSSGYLSGGKVGAWTAPNITSDGHDGIGQWSEWDIVSYLKTGVAHSKAIAAGDMATAVQNSFSLMNDDDVRDIARYLKSLPPIRSRNSSLPVASSPTNVPPTKTGNEKSYQVMMNVAAMSGADLYEGACSSCHGHDGKGSREGNIPPLTGVAITGSDDPSNLILTISEGVDRKVNGNHAFMPAFGTNGNAFNSEFDPVIIAKISDYVSSSFGRPSHHVSLMQVEDILSTEKNYGKNNRINYIVFFFFGFVFCFCPVVALSLRKGRLSTK